MIIWISGNTGSGKTYLAAKLYDLNYDTITLDGDDLRNVWTDLGLSREDRWKHNIRVAGLAAMLDAQNKNVIISVIAPYKLLRQEIDRICHPTWIYMPSTSTEDKPYENPEPRK